MTDALLFDPADRHRLFGLPPGADFPAALVRGLRMRLRGQPPEAIGNVVIYVNSDRMAEAVRAVFETGRAGFLPRIRLVSAAGLDGPYPGAVPGGPSAAPVPDLRRRLELSQLIAALLDRMPELAPRGAVSDLADSLQALMKEMQGEGVSPADLAALDLGDHAQHWQRSLAFISIVSRYFDRGTAGGPSAEPPDTAAQSRRAVLALAAGWIAAPPRHPVLVAGSTGSRGTTALFMQAVAGLPQGALVLPGFDFDMTAAAWGALDDAFAAEDHPQYRLRRLADGLGMSPAAVRPWDSDPPPDPARNRLISLAMRPAPVTDHWLTDGPALGDLLRATAGMTLIAAPSPRAEAAAIALRLAQAAAAGTSAALITPDRALTRQVAAALDRWGIRADDSGGQPLHLTAPGRFLRQLAEMGRTQTTTDGLLALLKHPLAASRTGARGPHLLWSRSLELWLRRQGVPFADGALLLRWAASGRHAAPSDGRHAWAVWLAGLLIVPGASGQTPLADHLSLLHGRAEALARGCPDLPATPEPAESQLWQGAAGIKALEVMTALAAEARHGGAVTIADFARLLSDEFQRTDVREPVQSTPGIMIWGTLEARVQGADLVILGGLNEGVWPQMPAPDPWLSRQMRVACGLLLPERQTGLAAHDFQQAAGAREVILSRAVRDTEAQTVPSRWLNRLFNLLDGLPEQGGPMALAAMRARGQQMIDAALALDAGPVQAPAVRPAPSPPLGARPVQLAVTGVRTLAKDPYAIYARHILRLRPLDPLRPDTDHVLRGKVVHLAVERLIATTAPSDIDRARFMAVTDTVLAETTPWPLARALFRVKLERVADWFVEGERRRQALGGPVLIEGSGQVHLGVPDFTLTAKPDRIDLLSDGKVWIYDYKSGRPPPPADQKSHDQQLFLEAAIALRGGFAKLGARDVAGASYIGLGSDMREVTVRLDDAATWEGLIALITAYGSRSQGYASKRVAGKDASGGDYDHLARFGEWNLTQAPVLTVVGGW